MEAINTNGYDKGATIMSEKLTFDEVKIPVPWGHISGKWWGPRNRQPVIAIHGWQDNAGTFDNLAPLLAKEGHSVLCIDLPGHGYSSHIPPGMCHYIFWDGLHFLRRIVKYHNWSNIQVIGHSLGGAIAFLYASSYPDDIEGYVAIDIVSPAVRDLEAICNKSGELIDKMLLYESLSKDNIPLYGYDEMVDIVEDAYAGSCTRASCEILMKRGMQPDGKGCYYFSRDPRLKVGGLAMMDINQAVMLAKHINCRVMNIKGSPGRAWENPEYYEIVLDAIEKNAKVLEKHVIEGTHHLHLNDPEKLAPLIVKFLK